MKLLLKFRKNCGEAFPTKFIINEPLYYLIRVVKHLNDKILSYLFENILEALRRGRHKTFVYRLQ